eukprot:4756398-Pyramimonas_sp.AAC.1
MLVPSDLAGVLAKVRASTVDCFRGGGRQVTLEYPLPGTSVQPVGGPDTPPRTSFQPTGGLDLPL